METFQKLLQFFCQDETDGNTKNNNSSNGGGTNMTPALRRMHSQEACGRDADRLGFKLIERDGEAHIFPGEGTYNDQEKTPQFYEKMAKDFEELCIACGVHREIARYASECLHQDNFLYDIVDEINQTEFSERSILSGGALDPITLQVTENAGLLVTQAGSYNSVLQQSHEDSAYEVTIFDSPLLSYQKVVKIEYNVDAQAVVMTEQEKSIKKNPYQRGSLLGTGVNDNTLFRRR